MYSQHFDELADRWRGHGLRQEDPIRHRLSNDSKNAIVDPAAELRSNSVNYASDERAAVSVTVRAGGPAAEASSASDVIPSRRDPEMRQTCSGDVGTLSWLTAAGAGGMPSGRRVAGSFSMLDS